MTWREACGILGLGDRPDAGEIKRAYRQRALEWHPDRFKDLGDKKFYAEKFCEAKEAYDFLRNAEFPELEPEDLPEAVSRHWSAGRALGGGKPEDVPLSQKLGLHLPWSLESVFLWGLVLPGGIAVLVLTLRWFIKRGNP